MLVLSIVALPAMLRLITPMVGAAVAPVQAYRLGTRLRLTVADIGVVLLLCEEHASTLATTAWEPTLARLREWGREPLPPCQ